MKRHLIVLITLLFVATSSWGVGFTGLDRIWMQDATLNGSANQYWGTVDAFLEANELDNAGNAVLATLNATGAAGLSAGTAGSLAGNLNLKSGDTAFYFDFRANGVTSNYIWTVPTAQSPGAGYLVTVGATGLMSYTDAATFLPIAGGTLTGELIAAIGGIEFQETDTITDCTSFSATGGGILYDDSEGVLKKCQDNVLTVLDTTGGTPAFSDISGATNTTAAMIVGTGASLSANGSGTIVATSTDNISGGTGGQILYQSAAGVTSKLANGTTGQLLQFNGTTVAPSPTNTITVNIDLEDAAQTADGRLTFDGTADQLELGDGTITNTFQNDIARIAKTETFTNKTLTAPIINAATGTSLTMTGAITGLASIVSKALDAGLTAAEVSGTMVLVTAATKTMTLPTAAAGYATCIVLGQGVTGTLTVTPAAGDYLVGVGVRNTAATAYAATSAAGNKICLVAATADDWYITSEVGTWSE